jgi:hypothetical protein
MSPKDFNDFYKESPFIKTQGPFQTISGNNAGCEPLQGKMFSELLI